MPETRIIARIVPARDGERPGMNPFTIHESNQELNERAMDYVRTDIMYNTRIMQE